jgi:hypothetical protein
MTVSTASAPFTSDSLLNSLQLTATDLLSLQRGEILVQTRPHTTFGGALTSMIYLPLGRSQVWEALVQYDRWVHFFPEVTQSRVLEIPDQVNRRFQRLYQAAEKTFLFLTAQVEVYLRVFELEQQHIRFQLEEGSFSDFTADVSLHDHEGGTVMRYSVSATPKIPIPGPFVEQAMRMDLPNNLRQLRRVLCG